MINLNGILKDGVHHYGLRVYYEDTDAIGIVYYANYLKYAERARTEMMRLLGFATISRDNDTAFAVRRCEVDFLKPAGLDDELDVVTGVFGIGGASIDLDNLFTELIFHIENQTGKELIGVHVIDNDPVEFGFETHEDMGNQIVGKGTASFYFVYGQRQGLSD